MRHQHGRSVQQRAGQRGAIDVLFNDGPFIASYSNARAKQELAKPLLIVASLAFAAVISPKQTRIW